MVCEDNTCLGTKNTTKVCLQATLFNASMLTIIAIVNSMELSKHDRGPGQLWHMPIFVL